MEVHHCCCENLNGELKTQAQLVGFVVVDGVIRLSPSQASLKTTSPAKGLMLAIRISCNHFMARLAHFWSTSYAV